MHRILVVKDVGLWISLNRHFAGVTSVRLSEATSLDMGLDLASIERPDVVVCSTESTGRTAAELEGVFRDRGLGAQRVVCVCADARGEPDRGAVFAVCRPDAFQGQVDRWVEIRGGEGVGPRVELLAHLELETGGPGEPRRGFASLLELSETKVLFESDDELAVGDALNLTFFLPPPEEGALRTKIATRAEVRSQHHPEKLLYVADLAPPADGADEALRSFVREQRSPARTMS